MSTTTTSASGPAGKTFPVYFMLFIAGMGGLLYGIDIGVIDPALPYLNKSIKLSEQHSSYIVAAVLAGSLFGSVIAGFLADWLGRKMMMIVSAVLFVASVGVIFTGQSFLPLLMGRLQQGMSGGVIAVVVPLFLAESLVARKRGSGTAIFQFMLTIGILLAAFVGRYYIGNAESATEAAGSNQDEILRIADHAWRSMFLTVMYPGLVFLVGSFMVGESPRWLFRRGRVDAARKELLKSRSEEEAELEMQEMADSLAAEHAHKKTSFVDSLAEIFTTRKYVLPFILACVILGCNQATGINSILQFMTTILQQSGLDALWASDSGTAIKALNCVMTIVAVLLVERKGRTFLLKMGTAGIIVSLVALAGVFYSFESKRQDVNAEVAAMIQDNRLEFDITKVKFANQSADEPIQISILSNYGNKQQVTTAFMPTKASQEVLAAAEAIRAKLPQADRELLAQAATLRDKGLDQLVAEEKLAVDKAQSVRQSMSREDRKTLADATKIGLSQKLLIQPDAKDKENAGKPLEIKRAKIGPIPSRTNGILAVICIALFVAFFAVGPGVCVWLALSELMPTRIRSAGMGIALLINQGVATVIAAVFLPVVGNYGFFAMFLFWAGCTVIYFITSAFFLPETKGKTLEEIEEHFEGKKKLA
ncbi:MAG: sugar porter family MFS transporter [Akkermansiaceae bacterium]|nr:sugar porter family MFS transporter [Akkermansiaceae bacterium]